MSSDEQVARTHIESLGGSIAEVPIGMIRANDWNPNEMADKAFDRLVKNIEESGMITLLQLTPMLDGETGEQYFRIIGGEHRFHALKLLGHEKVPAIILEGEKWKDEDLQKFETVRLNLISGKLNAEKMMALYLDVAERHDRDSLQDHFGITDDDRWSKLVEQVTRDVAGSGLPDKAKKEIKKEVEKLDGEVKTVENLTEIIHRIMRKYGSTVDKRFVYFDLGGKKHAHIDVDDATFELLESFLSAVDDEPGMDANVAFAKLLDGAAENVGK